MRIRVGDLILSCDRCVEDCGRYILYSGDEPVRSIANIPDNIEIIAEDGEIEHIPTSLEKAQADLAKATERIKQDAAAYMELLADNEARQARLERIEGLIRNLGDSLTLTKLIQFVKDLKSIITEAGNGED